MSKELVISANRHETKVAILEDDQLVEVYFQRANEYSLAGSIHKGKVTRVLPGMQSAFVDLGLERDTFLYVSDFFEENEDFDRVLPAKEDRPQRSERVERGPRPERTERPERLEQRSERGERPERSDRNERAERTPIAALEAAVEPLPLGLASEIDEGVEEFEAIPPSTAVSAAPEKAVGERPEDAEERERRGRRSRRRRNRGRGFPESKYASDAREPARIESAAPASESAISDIPSVTETESDFDLMVLPGESLAKYRHPVQNEPERVTAAPVAPAAAVHLEAPLSETPPTASAPTPEPEPEPAPAPVAERVVEAEPFEMPFSGNGAAVAREPEPQPEAAPAAVQAPKVNEDSAVTPEAEAIADIIAIERETAAFSPEELAESSVPSFEMLEMESGELEPSGSTESDDDSDELEVRELDPASAISPSEATPHQTQGREPGGRYQQRGPRRMRRRQRGGGSGPASGAFTGAGQAPATGPAPFVTPDESTAAPAMRPEPQQRSAARPERSSTMPSITELLKEGQEILVQIAKEPLGQKGARITSHIALPGRYVVFMPTLEHMGVSRKIASDEERLRLKKILQSHRSTVAGGFIVRTAGEGKSEEEILADMNFLSNLWLDIRSKAEKKPAPLLLHHDLDIVQRILRDQVTDQFKSIWVDNEEAYESILRFVQRFQPALVGRVKLYTRSAPVFDAFNITPELEKALRPKVWLKSGGYIVINQTEALVAIDVNTGKYVGKSNRLEDTIVKTNTEAVKEIVRQIRLRDLGGIIVVDFIDMDERKNRQKVMQALEEAMRTDKAPNKILQFNDFGLVAITRKRVKQSLERALCSPCPYCEGAGYVKSVQTTVADILVEAHKMAKAVEGNNVMLRVHPEVAKYLKSNQNKYLEEIEEVLRKPVLVKGDPALHQDKFDLA